MVAALASPMSRARRRRTRGRTSAQLELPGELLADKSPVGSVGARAIVELEWLEPEDVDDGAAA